MSKGSKRRKCLVSTKQFDENWKQVFRPDRDVIKESQACQDVSDAMYADFHAKVAAEEYQDRPEEKPCPNANPSTPK